MEDKKPGMKIEDLVGQKFGRLTVVEFVGQDKWKSAKWLCQCSCGSTKVLTASVLKSGNTKSCGCITKELQTKLKTKHGMHKHPCYKVWAGAKNRTTNKNEERWKDYGGRGITMCAEWLYSFENFWTDMGDSYEEGLTLDRIDVNGNYCKENCRWTTPTVQQHNQRKKKGCTSVFIGVNFHSKAQKFRAGIKVKGKEVYLGLFSSEYSAAVAYDNKSEEVYGDRPNNTERE